WLHKIYPHHMFCHNDHWTTTYLQGEKNNKSELEKQNKKNALQRDVTIKLMLIDLILRTCYPTKQNPLIEKVINCGAESSFDDSASINCFEAAWALKNRASGASNHTTLVIEVGTVPIFTEFSQGLDSREQAVWALGNIAGDSPACCYHVLD
ncbi:hypothetical protein MJO29_016896, partial [Puccinia striiformis f. sp. tritici]